MVSAQVRRYYIAMGKTPEIMGAVASSGYRWVLLGGVWLIYFCFGLMITSLAPLITPIATELGIGHAKMGAILGAWPLVYIAASIPCGMLLDRLGARIALLIAALIMCASGVARGNGTGGPKKGEKDQKYRVGTTTDSATS